MLARTACATGMSGVSVRLHRIVFPLVLSCRDGQIELEIAKREKPTLGVIPQHRLEPILKFCPAENPFVTIDLMSRSR